MWEEERRKFKPTPDLAETSHCLEDMVAAREEGRKSKKEIMEVKAGKKRKKEVWCGNHGEVAWGEAHEVQTMAREGDNSCFNIQKKAAWSQGRSGLLRDSSRS